MTSALELRQFGATAFLNLERSIEEFAVLLRRLGFGYLELLCELGVIYPQEFSATERGRLREIFQAQGITPTVHAAFYDINLASLNPLIRRASIQQLVDCIRLAHDLGARNVVVHPGDLPGDYPESWLPRARAGLIAALREALEIAEELDVIIGLENLARKPNRRLIQSPEEHLDLITALNSPNCRATLDVGHAHTFGLSPATYAGEIFPHLVEVHLHDNDGTGDQHRPLGRGTIAFQPLFEFLAARGYRGPLILEMKSLADLERCRRYLLETGSVRFNNAD